MTITAELLQKCLPLAAKSICIQAAPFLDKAMQKYGIVSKYQVAGFLAQVAHESNYLRSTSENLNYSAKLLLSTFPSYFNEATANEYARKPEKIANRVYADRMGNGDEASGQGWLRRGAGFIQTTGSDNQKEAAKEFGKKFVQDGEGDEIAAWLKTVPGASWSAAFFWASNGLNEIMDKPDSWRGKIGKRNNLDKFDYTTAVINGQAMLHRQERRSKYELILKVPI